SEQTEQCFFHRIRLPPCLIIPLRPIATGVTDGKTSTKCHLTLKKLYFQKTLFSLDGLEAHRIIEPH
ncbi:MAG: hypothetical protein PHY62_10760, partial [Gallionella sp.]|nr:hypothetical protein [Gallionella sp.]